MIETAWAKINLALHVRARREDGYHEIETLFAFVDRGDRLVAEPAERDQLRVCGEFAGELTDPFDNLVARALAALPHRQRLAITLEKNLPVAAGLGGGSADAGAIFRIVREMSGLPHGWRERAARLGADVPACVESEMAIGRGTGTELESVRNDLSGTRILLVNPRVPLPTKEVFAGWRGFDEGPLPEGTAREIALYGRNDLELSATRLASEVAGVLEIVRATDAYVTRMSGSGATCFGLFHDEAAMLDAQTAIARKRPDWWLMSGALR